MYHGLVLRIGVLIATFLVVSVLAPTIGALTNPWINPPHTTDAWLLHDYRVIIIARSDQPAARWRITRPSERIDAWGQGQTTHVSATLQYGTGWRDPSRDHDPPYALRDPEWQLVDAWRNAWCQAPPTPSLTRLPSPFYTVTIDCAEAPTVIADVAERDLPEGLRLLLQASTTE